MRRRRSESDPTAEHTFALDRLEDPCLVRPLPGNMQLSAVAADEAVLRALQVRGHAIFDEIRAPGREEGRVQQLRVAIADLCEVYGIVLDDERTSTLAVLDLERLDDLRLAIKPERRRPDG